jgi:hypothetical protein
MARGTVADSLVAGVAMEDAVVVIRPLSAPPT